MRSLFAMILAMMVSLPAVSHAQPIKPRCGAFMS